MSVQRLRRLTLTTGRGPATRSFYEAVGMTFRETNDSDGALAWVSELGSSMFIILEATPGDAPPRLAGGATAIGLLVDDVDAACSRARTGGARVLFPPHEAPAGRRAILADPDGRMVELNQAG
ncbi:MAG: VOC family protein [bacterium]